MGFWKFGTDVKETNAATLRALLPYHGRRMIDVDAVGLLAHAHQRGLCVAERRNGPRVGRQLDEHDVARIDQDACDQVESLLRAARDENARHEAVRMSRSAMMLDDAVEQRTETPRRAVLQDGPVAASPGARVRSAGNRSTGTSRATGYPGANETMSDICVSSIPIRRIADSRIRSAAAREEPLVVDHAVDAQGVVRTPLPAALAWLSRYV